MIIEVERLMDEGMSLGEIAKEQVHHIDMDKNNNNLDNLLIVGPSDHTLLHRAMKDDDNLDQLCWLIENAEQKYLGGMYEDKKSFERRRYT